MRPEEPGGSADTHAGSHPFQLTTGLTISDATIGKPVALAKDLHFKLPPGLIGNPTPFAQCPIADFLHRPKPLCSAQTVVGVARVSVRLHYGGVYAVIPFTLPLYNLEPAVGEPAQFGFVVNERVQVVLNTAVRTGADYGVTVSVSNISELAEFLSSEVTFWGVPGDPRHNGSRGECLDAAYFHATATCPPFEANHPPPLLSLPTSCSGPMVSTLEGDSWLGPEPRVVARLASTELPGLDGCNRLPFVPRIEVSPDGQQASKPTGLTVDVHVPQEGQLNPEGLAQSNVKDIAVTLPEGVTLNPSAADGLSSCSEAQIGYLPGESHPPSELHFSPKLPGSYGASEPLRPGVNFCPDASKIATVRIKTPLLPNSLEGAVYLASPQNFAGLPAGKPVRIARRDVSRR